MFLAEFFEIAQDDHCPLRSRQPKDRIDKIQITGTGLVREKHCELRLVATGHRFATPRLLAKIDYRST